MGALATLRLVTRRFRRVIYRIALERFGPACYFARRGSDGGLRQGGQSLRLTPGGVGMGRAAKTSEPPMFPVRAGGGEWLSAASAPTDQPAHVGYRGQVSPTKRSSRVAFIHRGVKAGKTRGQRAGEAENSPWLVHCADRSSGNPEVDYGRVLTGSG